VRYHGREIFGADPLPLHVRLHRLNQGGPPHDHDYMEAVLICGGSGRHVSARGTREARAGDVFILRPGAWHTYADCRDLEVYNCCFGAGLLRRELAVAAEEPTIRYLLVSGPLARGAHGSLSLFLPADEVTACRELLDAAARPATDGRESLAAVARIGYLLLFLERLARHVPLPEGAAGDSGSVAPHPAVREGVARLEADPARDWSLPELASLVHVEPSYLARLFTRWTGLAPMAYLARARAERAARLLLRTGLSVAEIGAEVGWGDPNYFARRFRAHFGLSPSAYRARFGAAWREEVSGGGVA
jgi:AraC family transcriptional regulator, L-rhamnose operon transcriptional activator RhaR